MPIVTGSLQRYDGSGLSQDVSLSTPSGAATDLAQSIVGNSVTVPFDDDGSTHYVGTPEEEALHPRGLMSNGNGPPVTTGYFAATSSAVVTGGATISVGVLAGPGAGFRMGASLVGIVVGGDDVGASLVNDNPEGSLVAYTGAGGNALVGMGQVNVFQTGEDGRDAVIFAPPDDEGPQANLLTSYGADSVSIYGPGPDGDQSNLVIAAGDGSDTIRLAGADLTFINLSSNASFIQADGGSTVTLGGDGDTALAIGAGGEVSLDAGGGNVTIAGGGDNVFNIVNLSGGTGGVKVIDDFSDDDTVNLVGYGGVPSYAFTAANPGSTTLVLADGTQIVFAGVADAGLVASRVGSG